MNCSRLLIMRRSRMTLGRGLSVIALALAGLSCDEIESAAKVPALPPQLAVVSESQPAQELVPAPAPPPVGPIKTIVYYFHGAVRCQTCLDIERYARETVFDSFPMELRNGDIEWRAVNYDVAENQHYTTDFRLPHPALVLVRLQNGFPGQWQLLGDTWDLVETPDKLKDYVREAIVVFAAQSSPAHD